MTGMEAWYTSFMTGKEAWCTSVTTTFIGENFNLYCERVRIMNIIKQIILLTRGCIRASLSNRILLLTSAPSHGKLYLSTF